MPAIGVHHTATSDAAWDGPANERRVRSGEGQAYYRRIYAWRDPDAAGDRKAHYRFIHHFVSADGAPGAASIVAARTGIGVLNGARGGTTIPDSDRRGVYNHLAAHLRDAGIEPPELRSLDEVMDGSVATEEELREGSAEGKIVRRCLETSVAKAESGGLHEFTMSTGSVDREGDRIDPDGWDVSAYMRNPVVLWAHDYRRLPIGRAHEVYPDGDAVKALIEFAPADLDPFADSVRRYYEAGFLKAVSVGFLPRKWEFAEEDGRTRGINFHEQELLEISAVPVPANPEALIEMRAAGIDSEPLIDAAKEIVRRSAKITTVREFESFLRDAGGFSRKEAAALASHGWRSRAQRDAEIPVEIGAQIIRMGIEAQRQILKEALTWTRKT